MSDDTRLVHFGGRIVRKSCQLLVRLVKRRNSYQTLNMSVTTLWIGGAFKTACIDGPMDPARYQEILNEVSSSQLKSWGEVVTLNSKKKMIWSIKANSQKNVVVKRTINFWNGLVKSWSKSNLNVPFWWKKVVYAKNADKMDQFWELCQEEWAKNDTHYCQKCFNIHRKRLVEIVT